MIYGCAIWLIAGRNLIHSLQRTQKGDQLGMYIFSLFIKPMIDELQASCALDLNI